VTLDIDPLSHAVLDLPSRRLKAAKIERLLGLDRRDGALRILEIGCGSGGISNYFGTQPAGHGVDAVDVVDTRVVREGFDFQLVTGTRLPFADEAFDVVLSNHVIEHVGLEEAQLAHLAEVRRVMKPGAIGYLAVPNRWRLIEPHYRLALLSVWPHAWRSPYLRLMGRGSEYDCEPLGIRTLEDMFRRTGLRFRRLGVEALRATLDLEHPDSPATAFGRRLPTGLLRPLEPLLPTLIYRLGRAQPATLVRSGA
jgi:SAM-dependent methyltransferase